MSFEEKVGKIVLFPFKLLVFIILIPVLIVAYPFVGVYLFFAVEGTLKQRLLAAVAWPVGLLVFNDFLSLGGLDDRTLTRFTDWLNSLGERGKKPRKGN